MFQIYILIMFSSNKLSDASNGRLLGAAGEVGLGEGRGGFTPCRDMNYL